MSLRDHVNTQLKEAMKAGDKIRVGTLRLVLSALKDQDIEARGKGKEIGEGDILTLFQKLIKSRQESLSIYQQAGRIDLAQQEQAEIEIIQSFLPTPLTRTEMEAGIDALIETLGASSLKDMGRVNAQLRIQYAGKIDMAEANLYLKTRLSP